VGVDNQFFNFVLLSWYSPVVEGKRPKLSANTAFSEVSAVGHGCQKILDQFNAPADETKLFPENTADLIVTRLVVAGESQKFLLDYLALAPKLRSQQDAQQNEKTSTKGKRQLYRDYLRR